MSGPVLLPASNYGVDVNRGRVPGVVGVSKFGKAPNSVDTTATDIWFYAGTQNIWLAPTAARIHSIESDNANDHISGSGARTVRVWYLPDWDTAETFEDVNLAQLSGTNMVNAAVMINRKRVIAWGTTQNAGTITATAATDATISAAIGPNLGQTQLLAYGFPSTKNFHITHWDLGLNESNASRTVDGLLLAAFDPENHPTIFADQDDIALDSAGGSSDHKYYDPPKIIEGPAIVKVQATASNAGMDVAGSFGGYLVDK